MVLSIIRQALRYDNRLGDHGENLAAKHLKQAGYRILKRNFTCRIGEIDIIAEAPNGKTIVIVEVKAASAENDAMPPEIRVNHHKQKKLISLAAHYCQKHKLEDRPIRFDVIAVVKAEAQMPLIRHHEGAFQSHV